MRQFKDVEWDLANNVGNIGTWQNVEVAVLMDIRDELKRINAALYCGNTLNIPNLLRQIERNTRKPKRPKRSEPKRVPRVR